MKTLKWAMAALTGLLAVSQARAQAPERTIDEIRVEAQNRAERGFYPLIGLDPVIFRQVILPWELRLLAGAGAGPR